MQFSIKAASLNAAISTIKSPCCLLAVKPDGKLGLLGRQIDEASGGDLSRALASGDLNVRAGSALLVHLSGPIKRVVLMSVGSDASLTDKAFSELIRSALRCAGSSACSSALSWLQDIAVGQRSTA